MFSGFVTLFSLMVLNNWFVQVDLYCALKDSTYYRWYFIIFYYVSVSIAINIIVAFILDTYSSVEKLDEERVKTMNMIEKEFQTNRFNKNLRGSFFSNSIVSQPEVVFNIQSDDYNIDEDK